MGERISNEEQVARWVAGNAVHRDIEGVAGGECCPDFSCCQPSLMADRQTRERFAEAHRAGDRKTCNALLGAFLGAMLAASAPEKRVHVTGDAEPQESS